MTKNRTKRDGSGRGVRANKGRTGCKETKRDGQGRTGQGRNRTK